MTVFHINCNYLGTNLHQLMVRSLSYKGVTNRVFVPVYDGTIRKIEPDDCVDVMTCFKKNDRFVFPIKQARIFNCANSIFESEPFDIIHAYTLFTDGTCARHLSETYGVPYVVAVRNTDVNLFFEKLFYMRKTGIKNLKMASKVFFLSEAYMKRVLDKYVPSQLRDEIAAKSIVVPNGIDKFWHDHLYHFERELDANVVKLIFAGKINKNKNIGVVQQAVKMLLNRGFNVIFNVVGPIEDKELFNEICNDEHTVYYPALPKEELINLYRQSDIFVMPSLSESFGLVYAEALTQGLPVIYTKGEGFDGQFPEGVVGYHVDAKSGEEIADAIERICLNYQSFSSNALKASERFKWDIIASTYCGEYEDIL